MLFFPQRIDGGRAVGTVDGSNIERAFSIHRITGAASAWARRATRPPAQPRRSRLKPMWLASKPSAA